MGVVFKARQVSMDRIVAIKFLPKKLAQDERIVARFLREARAAGQLAHPNIVSVHELGLAEGMHFIAMEYVDGNSIQKKLKENGPFTEKETLEISGQIAEALKLAHARGVLHRDIKPDNFLIDSAGRVRLADLGLASIESNRDGSLTQDGTTLGTPHYMSPEQCSGTQVDGRSDLYSLGASMFVMSTGHTPYEGSTAAAVMVKVLTEAPQSIKKFRPQLSPGFVALIEKLMQKDPAKRFQNATEAAEAIQLCKSGQYKPVLGPKPAVPGKATSAKPQASSPGQTEKQTTRVVKPEDSKLMPLMLGAAAAIGLLVILALFRGPGGTPQASNTHATTSTSTPAAQTASADTKSTPVIAYHVPGDVKPPEAEHNDKNPLVAKKLKALEDDFASSKLKPGEALRKLAEFRREHGDVLSILPGPRNRANKLERDIRAKLNVIGEEWKKLEPLVNEDLKSARINDALTKLCDFMNANESTDEALLTLARVEPLCSGLLGRAATVSAYNPREAVAMLKAITAKLPVKQDAQFKAAITNYTTRAEIQQELAELYEKAVQRALYFDPVAKTCFQFGDAAKLLTEAKLKFEASKKDALGMAELFNAADKFTTAMRAQVNAKPVDLASLKSYANVKVTRWDDSGLSYIAGEIPEPQSLKWDSKDAPDVILRLAKELRKADLDKATAAWDIGTLAFALGIKADAAKFIREAIAKDKTLEAAAAPALKLLKSVEAASAKPVEPVKPDKVESPPPAPLVTASNGDEESRQLLKDMQDAQKANAKDKLKALRADLETKFALTDFAKAHKKEFDEIVATLDAPAAKPKVDTLTPEEKEAREMLKKAGWTEIAGSWIWDKDKQAFRVEGVAELTNPALECDVNVSFKLLESTSKLRVLARVDKTAADRFASFGAPAGLGFGADVTYERAHVYLDWMLKKGRVKDPAESPQELRLENRPFNSIKLSMHKTITVTVDARELKSAGDARNTGDTRVIVSGPALIVPTISNTK